MWGKCRSFYTLRKMRVGKSQMQIAHSLGISYQAYQKLENPRKCNPTIKTLEKISSVFGRSDILLTTQDTHSTFYKQLKFPEVSRRDDWDL